MVEIIDRPVCGSDGGRFATPMDEEATILLKTIQAMLQTVGYMLVAEPDISFIERFGAEGLWDELPFADASQEVREAADHLRLWRRSVQERPEEVIDDLKTAWFRSLVGPAHPLAAPWESYYLDENNRLFTDSMRDVRAAYRAHGLEFEKKNREPDDHIGLMLSFLAVLAGREAEAVAAGDAETARSLQKDQADFVDNHVLTFVDEWAAAMAEKSDSDFYAGMALLACGLVKERRAQLEEVLRDGRVCEGGDASTRAGVACGDRCESCEEVVSCAC